MLAEKIKELGLKGEAFNFGTDAPVKIIDLVKKIVKNSDNPDSKIVILDNAKAEIRDQYLSSRKARTVLNWEPKYDLDSGLRETYAWYKDFFGK